MIRMPKFTLVVVGIHVLSFLTQLLVVVTSFHVDCHARASVSVVKAVPSNCGHGLSLLTIQFSRRSSSYAFAHVAYAKRSGGILLDQRSSSKLLSKTTWLLHSSANDDDNDEEGAKLAADFFKMAQAKGISVGENELNDEDEDDDVDEDDDEDEVEPNIPQGAINAFLGYDTGNVGEKLAGNVTLTNDQLYSEVKERVLESAGGFLSFVEGADEDDEDDDDDDEDGTAAAEPKPYEAPTTVPDSELTAGEVVITVLDALRHNDVPDKNRGVEILFGYSSPGSQIKNEEGLTPAEYADFLQETEYKILFSHQGAIIDKADYSFDGKKAFFTARLQAGPSPLDTVSVNFILSTTGREDDACWLIDSMLIRPQSMRRRRRK